KDGKAVKGGTDINPTDRAFAAKLYPKKSRALVEGAAEPSPDMATGTSQEATPLPRAVAALPHEAPNVFDIVIMDDFVPGTTTQKMDETARYARVFASYSGARVTSAMRLRATKGEPPTGFHDIIRTHERIKNYTNREQGSLPSDAELLTFGKQLFDSLFQGDVRRLYDEARTLQRRRLDLVFTSMIPWIAEKPWEFAYDASRGSFLATEDVRFTRNVLTGIPSDSIVPASGPLRILVASAQPVGFDTLSIDEEASVIARGFQPLVEAGLVSIDTLPRATPSKLHGYLSNGNYRVVHFIGHGVFDEQLGEGRLVFVNEQGEEYTLGERSVREIFCGRGLSLVFLNACETGRGGRVEFNKGVAQSLVAHGLPALVANQYSVLDSSATFFAQHFYWALSQGASLGQAAREARVAVNYSLHGEPIDWAVPVLYARDPNLALCDKPDRATPVPATTVRATSRRAAIARPMRIAVWDIDDVFPKMDRTLERMNAAQD